MVRRGQASPLGLHSRPQKLLNSPHHYMETSRMANNGSGLLGRKPLWILARKERVYEDSSRLEPVPDLWPVRLRRADRVRAARRGNSRVRVRPRRFATRAGGAGGG